jgi:hypothetical protein
MRNQRHLESGQVGTVGTTFLVPHPETQVEWCEKGKKTMQNQEIMVDQSLRHISYPQKLADFNGSMI